MVVLLALSVSCDKLPQSEACVVDHEFYMSLFEGNRRSGVKYTCTRVSRGREVGIGDFVFWPGDGFRFVESESLVLCRTENSFMQFYPDQNWAWVITDFPICKVANPTMDLFDVLIQSVQSAGRVDSRGSGSYLLSEFTTTGVKQDSILIKLNLADGFVERIQMYSSQRGMNITDVYYGSLLTVNGKGRSLQFLQNVAKFQSESDSSGLLQILGAERVLFTAYGTNPRGAFDIR